MLDTAFIFNAVPERYASLKVSDLEKYFAAAHGYQESEGDVKALPMKKWFNTNYHYIVPELSDSTKISLSDESKPVREFREANLLGIKTVPSVTGAFTFLSLATFTGIKKPEDFAADFIEAYASLAEKLSAEGAEWISIAEPYLVRDLSASDKSLFTSIYGALLSKIRSDSKIKVCLQTFFGDIRDAYDEVLKLGFDAIAIDFIEGKKSLELVSKKFPENTLLFAGIVNGKNIWRSNYEQKYSLIEKIKSSVKEESIVVSTSCSLLHVPYTTEAEDVLKEDIKKHFAFAEQKLTELSEIASKNEEKLALNKKLFESERVFKTADVQKALSELTEKDFVRLPAFAEREKIQHETLGLPLLPTTTIGSFPQ